MDVLKVSAAEFQRNIGRYQDLALRQHAAFFHDLARSGLDAETDGFLVNVESDIVKAVHRVLRVRFLSWRFLRQSQHRSRFENPSSFHLCIHTGDAVW